jgi:hypothetical protein
MYRKGPKATPLFEVKNDCVSSSTPCAKADADIKQHSISITGVVIFTNFI